MPSQPTSQNSIDYDHGSGQSTSAFVSRKLPRCELCNVECDTHEILEQHKNGKKHQKNIKRNAISGRLEQVSTSELLAEASFQPNQIGGFKDQSLQSLSTQPVNDKVMVDPHKNATTHRQHQTLFTQGTTPIQATPPGALPQYSTSSVHVPVPSQSHLVPIRHPRLVTCHLCKVDCNTLEIYDKHKNGKKHQKNLKAQGDLQKCKNSIVGGQMEPNILISEWRPEIPTHPDKVEGAGVQQCQLVNIESKVEVENGKVEEGEPSKESAEQVKANHCEDRECGFKCEMREAKLGSRVGTHNGSKRPEEPPEPKEFTSFPCELCNIKCKSLVVYKSHLLGKKHLAKAKRLLGDPETVAARGPTIQALIQQSTFASSSIAPVRVGPSEGYSTQNAGTINVHESAPVSEIEKATVETVHQLQSLSEFFMARHMVNTEAKSEGGPSEVELKKQISCTMQLTNKSNNHVAFKVKTTNPEKYCIQPNTGVMSPHTTCDVIVITMQAQKEAPADVQCWDKFLLQSVVVSSGATLKDVTTEMFTNESENRVDECKLRVVYVPPPRPPSPVREGSEEGSCPRKSENDNVNPTSDFNSMSKASAEPQETSTEVKALISKLAKEKISAMKQINKLQQELEQLRHQGNRSHGGIPLLSVAIASLTGILLGYLLKRT